MSRKSKAPTYKEELINHFLSCLLSEPQKTYSIDLNPQDIAEKLKPYENKLVLVDRVKDIVENYGKEGAEYAFPPIKITTIHTLEAGTLIDPVIVFDRIPEKIIERYLVMNPQIGMIMIKDKMAINLPPYSNLSSRDIIFTQENIPLFLEDFVRKLHETHDKKYIYNNDSKFYSEVKDLDIICGENEVKEFLTDNYKGIGKKFYQELQRCQKNSKKPRTGL